MPEGVEIELYRRAAEPVIGRTITAVSAPDALFVKGGVAPEALSDVLVDCTVTAVRRIGKLLLLVLDGGDRLGLRFGMTGRLVVDDRPAIEELEYGSDRDDPAWDRFALDFESGGRLRINDPRRLGGVELNPALDRLGPDLFDATPAVIRDRVACSSAPLKSRLLDQSAIAGVGNLIADETLWRAGLDPARPARSLSTVEIRRLSGNLRRVAAELLANGGSHTGRLQPERVPGGRCPRDRTPLERRTVGGRTTYSCPRHQV